MIATEILGAIKKDVTETGVNPINLAGNGLADKIEAGHLAKYIRKLAKHISETPDMVTAQKVVDQLQLECAGYSATNAALLEDKMRLEDEITRMHENTTHLQCEWQKYRLALNRIGHASAYGIKPGFDVEIARRALVIGENVHPVPKEAYGT